MAQQLDAVHSQQQAFRAFVDGFPRAEVVDALKTKLEAIDHLVQREQSRDRPRRSDGLDQEARRVDGAG